MNTTTNSRGRNSNGNNKNHVTDSKGDAYLKRVTVKNMPGDPSHIYKILIMAYTINSAYYKCESKSERKNQEKIADTNDTIYVIYSSTIAAVSKAMDAAAAAAAAATDPSNPSNPSIAVPVPVCNTKVWFAVSSKTATRDGVVWGREISEILGHCSPSYGLYFKTITVDQFGEFKDNNNNNKTQVPCFYVPFGRTK